MKLINKDALVAEIERRIKNLYPKGGQGMVVTKILKDHYEDLLSFLNSIEVKEVDLENLIDEYTQPISAQDKKEEPFTQLEKCARHFFELGNKAQKEEKI